MASKARLADRVDLQVTTPADAETDPGPGPFASIVSPWILAAAVGTFAVALIGWVLIAVWVIIGWATEIDGTFVGTLVFASRVWLAGLGAGLKVGSTLVTIVPLGLTLLAWVGLAGVSMVAARTAKANVDDSEPGIALRVTWQTSVTVTVTFVVLVVVMAFSFVEATQAARALGTAALVAGSASLLGAAVGAKWRPGARWPVWARRLPAALGAGIAGLTLLSVIALATAAVANWDRMTAIGSGLELGPIETGVVIIGQLAFLPNALLWAGSYALGAGFTIGLGSSVTVASSTVGLLPAFPIFGLVPEPGATGGAQPVWLVGGAIIGLVVGAMMLTGWGRAGDRTQTLTLAALIGGCTGVATALLWAALTTTARGDLGTGRLVDMGPRMLELVSLSAGLIGIPAAAAAAAIVGLAHQLPPAAAAWLQRVAERVTVPVAVPGRADTDLVESDATPVETVPLGRRRPD